MEFNYMQIKTWWEESFTDKIHVCTQSPGSASSLLMDIYQHK